MKSIFRKMLLLACFCVICFVGKAQTIIQMEEYGGIYRIPCKVNGAKMKLIFDTGADKVCISLAMAEYLLDNDYLSKNDIKGSGSSTVADGSIVDHIKINIRDIEIDGIHLKNVEAVVIDGQNAPLLLGQSAIKKLGKYSVSGNKLIIGESNTSKKSKGKYLTEEEVNSLIEEADKAYDKGAYYIALEKYRIVFDENRLNSLGKLFYGDCLFNTGHIDEALEIYLQIQEDIESEFTDYKDQLYEKIGLCYESLRKYSSAIPYYEKAMYYTILWGKLYKSVFIRMIRCYINSGQDDKIETLLNNKITEYLNHIKIKASDCWDKNLKDEFLGDAYHDLTFTTWDVETINKYNILAAAWGSEEAIEWCKYFNLNYLTKPYKYKY